MHQSDVDDFNAERRARRVDASRDGHEPPTPPRPAIERFTVRELREKYGRLNSPVVDGLFRERETVNLISTSKVGKSWLAYSLALSIVTGRPWLGRFNTSSGPVLIIDNELHKPTLAYRIPMVANALEIPAKEYEYDMHVWPLRGNLRTIHEIEDELQQFAVEMYRAIIIDAKYRMIPPGRSENDNAAETHFYNAVDAYAEMTGAAVILVHHTSKGLQGDRRTTDVGAGAGAQSRAADCHLVLREHEEANVVVLDAALRSFAPIEPLPLRWSFPLWVPDDTLDAGKIKGRLTVGERRQVERDTEGMDAILKALDKGPATAREIGRRVAGMGTGRRERLLDNLEATGKVHVREVTVRGNNAREYSRCPF